MGETGWGNKAHCFLLITYSEMGTVPTVMDTPRRALCPKMCFLHLESHYLCPSFGFSSTGSSQTQPYPRKDDIFGAPPQAM